jgi:hypothetical protein
LPGIKLGLLVVGIDVDDIIGSNVGCEDVGLVEGVGKMVGKSATKGGSVAGGFVYGGSILGIGLGLDVVVELMLGSDDDVGFVVGIKLGLPVVGFDVDNMVGSNVGCDNVGLVVTGIASGGSIICGGRK